MAQFIRFNLFPLEVRLYKDGNQVKSRLNTRAIVTDDEVFVYEDNFEGPTVWFTDRLEDFSGDATNGWTVLTSEGYDLQIKRSQGCGCGSRLKGYNPFPSLPYEKVFT